METKIHPWRQHFYKVPEALEGDHLATQVDFQWPWWGWQAHKFPWDAFWQFMQKFFDRANQLLHQLSRWRSSMWRSYTLTKVISQHIILTFISLLDTFQNTCCWPDQSHLLTARDEKRKMWLETFLVLQQGCGVGSKKENCFLEFVVTSGKNTAVKTSPVVFL